MSCDQLIVQQVAIDTDTHLDVRAVGCESFHDSYHNISNPGAALIFPAMLLKVAAAILEGVHL